MSEPEHFDVIPENFDWNEIYSGQEADYLPPDALVLGLASGLEPGDVLDVGCGAGGLLLALAKLGWGVHGVDVAAKGIAAASAIMAKNGVEATLAVADASAWSPPRTYELVTNTFALPLKRADQVGVYRMIREAVAPGGTVILKDFDLGMSDVGAFGGCDLIDLAQLLEAFEGFEILRAEVVETPVHDHGQGGCGKSVWTAALLVARRPRAAS